MYAQHPWKVVNSFSHLDTHTHTHARTRTRARAHTHTQSPGTLSTAGLDYLSLIAGLGGSAPGDGRRYNATACNEIGEK